MMTRRQATTGLLAGVALAAVPGLAAAQELKRIDLPAPRAEGGMPLMSCAQAAPLDARLLRTGRLPPQILSDLFGRPSASIVRAAIAPRPYWRHIMVIDVYAAMADGVWLYDPKAHSLLPHLKDDIRAQTGLQDFVATRAAQSRLCRPRRAHGRIFRPKSADFTHPSIPASSARTLPVLRLGGPRHGVSRSGRLSKARSNHEAAGSAVCDLCPDGRIPARLDAEFRHACGSRCQKLRWTRSAGGETCLDVPELLMHRERMQLICLAEPMPRAPA